MAERRRLPVLNATAPEEDEEADETRPGWHWVGFGTVAIFAAWLPLAYAAGALSSRIVAARFGPDASKDAIELALAAMTPCERALLMARIALPSLVGLAIASFGGGFVVGRFGTGAREAALAGGTTALIASIMAWAGFTITSFVAALVTFAIAIGFAWWGGRFGVSKRS